MNAIPVLGIPHYNRLDLTLRCIQSIDHAVDTLVIVMNGDHRNAGQIAVRAGCNPNIHAIKFVEHPNAGVAGAWNEIIKLFPAQWWLISNNDIQFAPGDLARMAFQVERRAAGVCYGNHGASWFGITAACVETVGLFDENIYPAYLEDCDYSVRCDLLGMPRANVPGCTSVHGDEKQSGSCTVNISPQLAAENSRTHGLNHGYYQAKWGGPNGHETYKHPFNDPQWPVWAWRFLPSGRADRRWTVAG